MFSLLQSLSGTYRSPSLVIPIPDRCCLVNVLPPPKLVWYISKSKSCHPHSSDVPFNSDHPSVRIDDNSSQIQPAEDELDVGEYLQNIAVLHVLKQTPKCLSSYIILKDDFVVIDRVIDKVDLGSQNLTQVVFQLLSHLRQLS